MSAGPVVARSHAEGVVVPAYLALLPVFFCEVEGVEGFPRHCQVRVLDAVHTDGDDRSWEAMDGGRVAGSPVVVDPVRSSRRRSVFNMSVGT